MSRDNKREKKCRNALKYVADAGQCVIAIEAHQLTLHCNSLQHKAHVGEIETRTDEIPYIKINKTVDGFTA